MTETSDLSAPEDVCNLVHRVFWIIEFAPDFRILPWKEYARSIRVGSGYEMVMEENR